MKKLSSKLITNHYTLLTLEEEWETLKANVSNSNLCTSWLWLTCWCDVYLRQQDKLFIHTYYYEDQLVGLLPFYLKKLFFGYELRFVATGEPEKHEISSEFQDFIIKGNYQNEVFVYFTQQLKNYQNIIAITFNNILPTSLAYLWWQTYSSNNFRKKKKILGIRYIIPVQENQQKQIENLQSKSTRRHANKYIAMQACTINRLDNTQEFEDYYQALMIKHNQSWRNKKLRGAFEQPEFINFHRKLAKKLLQKNKLILFKLLYKKQCIALFYGIIDGDTLHYYQSAISFIKDISSVGVAMHIEAINIAREQGLKFYDLMQGSENSYKNRYIISQRSVLVISLESASYLWTRLIIKLKNKLLKIIKKT